MGFNETYEAGLVLARNEENPNASVTPQQKYDQGITIGIVGGTSWRP